MKLLSTRRHRFAAVVTAGALAVGGAAAAITALAAPASVGTASLAAATGTVAKTSAGGHTTTGHGAKGHRAHRKGALLKRTDHATVEVHVKGSWVTYDLDRGTVTAVSPSSITLARRDGRSVTVKIDSATKFGGVASATAVTDGTRATVISEAGTARRVIDRGVTAKSSGAKSSGAMSSGATSSGATSSGPTSSGPTSSGAATPA